MSPPVDDSAMAIVSLRSVRSAPTVLASVCSGFGMMGVDFLLVNADDTFCAVNY